MREGERLPAEDTDSARALWCRRHESVGCPSCTKLMVVARRVRTLRGLLWLVPGVGMGVGTRRCARSSAQDGVPSFG